MRWSVFVVIAIGLVFSGCAGKTPPNLSSQGVAAFHGTQVIQTLDLLRDAAIAANDQKPPVLSTDTTRKIVTYHRSAITVVHATPNGWRAAVLQGLEETLKNLPPNETKLLAPYVTLVTTIANEVN